MDLGTFPIRFPSPDDPGGTGWHIDSSFPPETGDSNDFLNWRVNVTSKGRALLMLFLFSDVRENDAPTRIRAGSQLMLRGGLRERARAVCRCENCRPTVLGNPAPAGRSCHR